VIAGLGYDDVLSALEAVTGEMLATDIDQVDRLHELAERRGHLAAQISRLKTGDASLLERLERVIAASDEVETRVRKMIAALECEIANADRESRFARELGSTVPAESGLLDLQV